MQRAGHSAATAVALSRAAPLTADPCAPSPVDTSTTTGTTTIDTSIDIDLVGDINKDLDTATNEVFSTVNIVIIAIVCAAIVIFLLALLVWRVRQHNNSGHYEVGSGSSSAIVNGKRGEVFLSNLGDPRASSRHMQLWRSLGPWHKPLAHYRSLHAGGRSERPGDVRDKGAVPRWCVCVSRMGHV